MQSGMEPARGDLGGRRQCEPSLGKAGVRQHEIRGIDDDAGGDEQVEVERARSPPALHVAIAPRGSLQPLAEGEQSARVGARFHQRRSVEEVVLRLTERRAAPDTRACEHSDLAREARDGGGEGGEHVAPVPTDADQEQHPRLRAILR